MEQIRYWIWATEVTKNNEEDKVRLHHLDDVYFTGAPLINAIIRDRVEANQDVKAFAQRTNICLYLHAILFVKHIFLMV